MCTDKEKKSTSGLNMLVDVTEHFFTREGVRLVCPEVTF